MATPRDPRCRLFGYAPDNEPVHEQNFGGGVVARHLARNCSRSSPQVRAVGQPCAATGGGGAAGRPA